MTISEAKRITRMNEWRQLIHERQQSGQSVRTWCLQNGIRENSYYYWLRIIREAALCEVVSSIFRKMVYRAWHERSQPAMEASSTAASRCFMFMYFLLPH